MNRKNRAMTAERTLEIISQGYYDDEQNNRVNIQEEIEHSTAHTQYYTPDALELLAQTNAKQSTSKHSTKLSVSNRTTLAAAFEAQQNGNKVLCLNFASAKNPGGGFLGGSQAQEESLARASSLYASLTKDMTHYEINRRCGSCLYTHNMIYSPDVVVFRDDDDQLLAAPYKVSFITAPAVNFGALKEHEKSQTASVMKQRLHYVLALAKAQDYQHLILGAWGCGVFRNDPAFISQLYADALQESGQFHGVFETIDFAVLDNSNQQKTFLAFTNQLSPLTQESKEQAYER
ncbi:TIGR02452 family protein [Pleionea sp. CnH1-48]|uniref:TIGR02452 family protein n=1 Tax=Pleionea sp. CnH1-48 TaxID=2954494 RepID=UPI002097183B|nr:TIGR02452 family protein [Pleionea sp. CnH1-48]MCO7226733.1 TIGR02452 family protein [Pleionea sp. CnH1-48]